MIQYTKSKFVSNLALENYPVCLTILFTNDIMFFNIGRLYLLLKKYDDRRNCDE